MHYEGICVFLYPAAIKNATLARNASNEVIFLDKYIILEMTVKFSISLEA